MSIWMQILLLLSVVALIFWAVSVIRRNPESFSAANMNKSLTTLGILALILIGFIALMVFHIRHHV